MPIYLRVVIGGRRLDVTTKVFIDLKHWSREYGKMKNTTDEARRVNEILDGFKLKAFDYQRELMAENKPVCVEKFQTQMVWQIDGAA